MDPLRKAVKSKVASRWTQDDEGPVLEVNIKGDGQPETGGYPTEHRTAPDGVVFDDDDQEFYSLPEESGDGYGDGLPGDDEPDEAIYEQLADEAEALGVTEEEFPAWAAERLSKMKDAPSTPMPKGAGAMKMPMPD